MTCRSVSYSLVLISHNKHSCLFLASLLCAPEVMSHFFHQSDLCLFSDDRCPPIQLYTIKSILQFRFSFFETCCLPLISNSSCLNLLLFSAPREEAPPDQREDEQDEEEEGTEDHRRTMIDRLLEKHGACIPHHEPKLYRAAAAKTKSIPGFSILAFPDFWGHLPPPRHEPMAPRKPNIQRYSILIKTLNCWLCRSNVVHVT